MSAKLDAAIEQFAAIFPGPIRAQMKIALRTLLEAVIAEVRK